MSCRSFIVCRKEKSVFVSTGREAAFKAGNVYGEHSAEAVKKKKKQTVNISLPQREAITV